ncbi:MAG: DUF5591 domain-containing protein [Euryarchaeota archaeon]|nr:DUF5591 domain-containing protein [Euryarchaeota archaeon]
MFELLEIDNYRIGLLTKNKKEVTTPCLAKFEKGTINIGGITYDKPFFKGIKTDGYLRPSYSIPHNIGTRMVHPMNREVVPIHMVQSRKLNERYKECEGELFLFKEAEARRFLDVFFHLRKKYPDKLFFIDCPPESMSIYAFLGFDIFPYSQKHEKALEGFQEKRTKWYVEKEANSSIKTKRLLRVAYREFPYTLLKNMKIKDQKDIYISSESLYRPEAVYWRRRVKERYTPHSNFIVLLPCSAKKPYSLSQSHKRFIQSIKKGVKNRKQYYGITQLILTSPLGVVPRELEDYANYDIVVTGDWSHEEKEMTRSLLRSILAKADNPRIIAHLPEEYKGLCEDVEFTDDLTETIKQYHNEIPKRKNCKIRKISEFLYGVDIFPEDITVKKRRKTTEIYAENNLLARYDRKRKLKLTIEGAQLLYEQKKQYATIDFNLRGDVFCVGVMDCDKNILPGEDVAVVRDGKAVGIGKAIVPGYMMSTIKRGKAVDVRSRTV